MPRCATACPQAWPARLRSISVRRYFRCIQLRASRHAQSAESDPVTIIYTSGTSGEAKGVILNAGNIEHMLDCIDGRLDLLMESGTRQDRVSTTFHFVSPDHGCCC